VLLTIEKVLILKSVDMFSGIPEETLAEVSLILEELTYGPGDTIVTEGEIGRSMYIIIDGLVRVHRGESELARIGERAVFGELAALSPEPRTATVTAVEETRVFRIDYETLHELMAEHPSLVSGIIQVLCGRVASLNTQIGGLREQVSQLNDRLRLVGASQEG